MYPTQRLGLLIFAMFTAEDSTTIDNEENKKTCKNLLSFVTVLGLLRLQDKYFVKNF